jgi:hypothetical protein
MNLTNLNEQTEDLRAMKLGFMKTKMATVLKTVSFISEIEEDEIKAKTRYSAVIAARHAFMYVCHVHLGINCSTVGRFINKDHATVLHAKKKVNGYVTMGVTEEVVRVIDAVVEALRAANKENPYLDMEEISGEPQGTFKTEMDKVFEQISYTDKRIEFWQKRKEYLLDLKNKMYQH